MFIGVLFIAIGLALLFNALGLFNGAFWGIFWAIFFIAVGFRMMIKKGKCPMCGWGIWHDPRGIPMHDKIHERMHEHCCDHNHDRE